MTWLIAASLAAPLAVAALLCVPSARAHALKLVPWMPLPALAVALAAPVPFEHDLSSLLLGMRLGLDEDGRVFLLVSALIWLAAGWFAQARLANDARRHRFGFFLLLTQVGNFGVCLAPDPAGFYMFYALMGFSAYGLVVHHGRADSMRAGRVYLTLVVTGEALILTGLFFALGGARDHALAVICLILGFGIKTGLPLLHVSLPLAYSAAPVPAAAGIAGAMINAGLLGWLRFLPLGEAALPAAGAALMLAGLAAIFLGAAAGLAQRDPAALLAYSSISHMGYATLGVGAALAEPALWSALAPALTLYAAHHALAKAALFLGLGVVQGRGAGLWPMLGLALPTLALAGAPLTSGMLAKNALKHALAGLPAPWADLVPGLLALGALATALLMLRLVWLLRRERAETQPAPIAPWLLLLLAVAGLAAALAPAQTWQQSLRPDALLASLWPLLVALLLATVAVRLRWRAPDLPPGDVIALLPAIRAAAGRRLRWPSWPSWPAWRAPAPASLPNRLSRLERRFGGWPIARLGWLALLAALTALLVLG